MKQKNVSSVDQVRREIAKKIFDLFEQYECAVGTAEVIMEEVKQMIWETVPVKGGCYSFCNE